MHRALITKAMCQIAMGQAAERRFTEKLPAMQENWVPSLSWEDPLEKGMATHSSIFAWRIPWIGEPVGYSPWGCKELDKTEWLTLLLFQRVYREAWIFEGKLSREILVCFKLWRSHSELSSNKFPEQRGMILNTVNFGWILKVFPILSRKQHTELCSVLCGSLGGGGFKEEGIHVRMAEFLHCPPETITTLLIGYIPTQNTKLKGKKKSNFQII